MPAKALTDIAIKALKPRDKAYKVSDGSVPGLVLSISPTGKKVFRLSYLFEHKAQLLTLGSYPELSLLEARQAALEAKKKIKDGINPTAEKKRAKAQAQVDEVTFRHMAEKWLDKGKLEWSAVHIKDTKQKLDCHILPRIGNIAMAAVSKADVKAVLDTLSSRQKFATLKKVRSIISQVFQYAIAHDHPGVEIDLTIPFRNKGMYASPKVEHRAAFTTSKEAAALMKAIHGYDEVSKITCIALKFSALTFCRPGEIRHAEWAELELEDSLWRIPAKKMKMDKPHLVPLATQTLELLRQLRPMTGHSRYLFPSIRSAERPMSEMTITAALRRMGFGKEQMCAHGFRGMASSLLNEQGYNRDWIEVQLSHSEVDKIRAAYNHTDFLQDRRKMMQAWADFLFMLMTS